MIDSLNEELAQRAVYHGVSFTPRAVIAARHLARCHPQQTADADTTALDWLDEAAVNARTVAVVGQETAPVSIDEIAIARVVAHATGVPIQDLGS